MEVCGDWFQNFENTNKVRAFTIRKLRAVSKNATLSSYTHGDRLPSRKGRTVYLEVDTSTNVVNFFSYLFVSALGKVLRRQVGVQVQLVDRRKTCRQKICLDLSPLPPNWKGAETLESVETSAEIYYLRGGARSWTQDPHLQQWQGFPLRELHFFMTSYRGLRHSAEMTQHPLPKALLRVLGRLTSLGICLWRSWEMFFSTAPRS